MKFDLLKDLQSQLDAENIPADVEFFDSTESTNSLALKILEEKLKMRKPARAFAVATDKQTAGRGRFDRKWISQKGASICISVAVPIGREAKALESFTVRAGTKTCENLRKICGAKIFVKWPNDIYSADGKKICGMLSELRAAQNENQSHWIVFGAGLNFDFSKLESELPSEIAEIAADFKSLSENSAELSICKVAAEIVRAAISAALETFEGDLSLPRKFADVDWLGGKFVHIDIGAESFYGEACGVDSSGRLIVKANDGSIKIVGGGEATIRKNAK